MSNIRKDMKVKINHIPITYKLKRPSLIFSISKERNIY